MKTASFVGVILPQTPIHLAKIQNSIFLWDDFNPGTFTFNPNSVKITNWTTNVANQSHNDLDWPGFTRFVANTYQSQITCFWGKSLNSNYCLCKKFDISQLWCQPQRRCDTYTGRFLKILFIFFEITLLCISQGGCRKSVSESLKRGSLKLKGSPHDCKYCSIVILSRNIKLGFVVKQSDKYIEGGRRQHGLGGKDGGGDSVVALRGDLTSTKWF